MLSNGLNTFMHNLLGPPKFLKPTAQVKTPWVLKRVGLSLVEGAAVSPVFSNLSAI